MFNKQELEVYNNSLKEMWKYYKWNIIKKMKIWKKHIKVILNNQKILLKL